MAFDGLTIYALTQELNNKLSQGRLYKIAQPEKDELFLTIKNNSETYRLLISANASLPLVYLTDVNKPAPLTAPGFCMLLRKHINNGRILSVTQPGLERIIDFKIEHLNEMGDLCIKHLIIELMGKHSNIIFIDDNNKIIDSIKRINASVSSVREVLPGGEYFIPNTSDKINPWEADVASFINAISSKPVALSKAIYTSYTGISPIVAEHLCYSCSIDSSICAASQESDGLINVANAFIDMLSFIKNNNIKPIVYYENGKPKEYGVFNLSVLSNLESSQYPSVSSMLENYYSEKSTVNRVHQHSVDLRQIVTGLLEKDYKKLDLQSKQLEDTQKRDTYRIYGELLNTYGYNIPEGATEFEALNYYDNTTITIPLDSQLNARENSVKYFNKYNKLKRTFEAMNIQIASTSQEIEHLESIQTALDIAVDNDDLAQIREELALYGFIKKQTKNGKGKSVSPKVKPMHYTSSDGFDIFVGKNNLQNEEVTFKIANGSDIWFHAKNAPGSHVILKANNLPLNEIPDRTIEEAANLAAHYSKLNNQDRAEIDYIERKHIKKVAGAPIGFVIYHTNYSMMADTKLKL